MPSKEISDYFEHTVNRKTREGLQLAVELVRGPRIAIDCGCGAGSDIAFLRESGFYVYAFDCEAEAVARCRDRFKHDENVLLSQDTFNSFDYPAATLVLAESSLFFCPSNEFDEVWLKILHSLAVGGVFVGSFLGPEDTMAGPDYKKEVYWSEVLVCTEGNIRHWLRDFEIESFTEHKSSGLAPDGNSHQWHIFSVVAKKS